MITILTGVPGAGKTAKLIEMIMADIKLGRKVFVHGIPELLLNVQPAGDMHHWQDGTWLKIGHYNPDMAKTKGIKSTWMPRGCPSTCEFLATCPRVGLEVPDAGSVLYVDEAHTEFPQRASGRVPPPHVEALTTHRHQGLDFVFISQKPSFLDPFVRDLASRHLHLSLNPFSFNSSRNLYEWTEFQPTVSRTSKLLASKTSYKPSPAVFPLYASATVHTKLDQKLPTIFKVFMFVLLLIAMMGLFLFQRVQTHKEAINAAYAAPIPQTPPQSIPEASVGADGQRSGQADTIAAQPYTPPPRPKVSACLASSSRCTCYNAHGVPVPMSDTDCRDSAHHPTEHFDYERQQPLSHSPFISPTDFTPAPSVVSIPDMTPPQVHADVPAH